MKIGDKVKIEVLDKLNYGLFIRRGVENQKTKEVEEKWVLQGYYGKLKNALSGALKQVIFLDFNKVEEISNLIAYIEKCEQEVLVAVKNIDKKGEIK